MIRKVYSYAPYEFQRTFLELRETIDKLSIINTGLEPVSERLIRNLKNKAVKQFNNERICEHDSFHIWSELFDRIFDFSDRDYHLLKMINETYWFEFCYHLRIKQNDNVPEYIIDYWKENLDYDTRNMYNQLIDLAIQVREKHIVLSPFILSRIEERYREKERIDELLMDLYDGKERINIERNYMYRSKLQ
ncbi:MAG: hypothetical protein DRN57_06820 [Thermoplasmata archaeon]|nr:MAG: hypothetical protein DRN57_06820 [Thermoplasmata archaeon]